ncbi:hypothetical protein GJ744_010219 [Endocarpon pusillum]|uniref:Uncharacterized protein n=1 Tax=Endocarpon pusillum TaxID=364733 RepID=A0A8H7AIH2_9EURO|nr:hypothetical protein GJ744_010219 [Endocarpon pusillum]
MSKLIPSRKFYHHIATTKTRRTPSADVVLEGSSVSSGEAHESNHPFMRGHRPVSAPPSSSKRIARIDRHLPDHPSLPELDFVTDIHLHGKVSANSQSSSAGSLNLFPRPLTFRRTVTNPSPLVSPTPVGRGKQDAAFAKDCLRCEHVEERPMTRGKSPKSKRRSSVTSVLCLPGRQDALSATKANCAFQNIEGNPFTDRLGLARLGSNKRRSSNASLSTLKIPRSFRPSISRGSSIYSRDIKDTSVLQRPGLANEFSASLQSLPQPGLTLATSYDGTLNSDFGQRSQDLEAKHDVSPCRSRESQSKKDGYLPQTPTPPARSPLRETAQVGTASSDTFGRRMAIPRINIARSSDDVFGAAPVMAESRNDRTVVVEDGRVLKRVRAVESKLSQEDLVRYGGKTAPGGVGWI